MTAFRKPVGLPPLKEVKTDRRIAEDGGAVAAVAVAVGGLLDRPGLHHYMGMVRPHVGWTGYAYGCLARVESVAAITVITPYLVLVSAKYVG